MSRQTIKIPKIVLEWSDWISWHDLAKDARTGEGIYVPNRKQGVYEVKRRRSQKRLAIGKAANLRMRIKQGLVKGKSSHSAGKKIRKKEVLSKLVVRWAETDRPSAVEEELHRLYVKKYRELPEYVQHT